MTQKKISLTILAFLLLATISPAQIAPVYGNEPALSPFLNVTDSYANPAAVGKKNAGLAMLFSALLPGMGELYVGEYGNAKYFTIADFALLGTYIGMDYYSGWQKDNYLSYASSFGGVQHAGKDDDYYAIIGAYMSIEDYNNDMAIKRRFDNMYATQTHYWKWNSNAERKAFREQWLSSERAADNLQFVIGAMILNRVISIINAARLTASHNKRIAESDSQVFFGYSPNPVTLQKQFTLNLVHKF